MELARTSEDANYDAILAAVNGSVQSIINNQPGKPNFSYHTDDYYRRCGFAERKIRWEKAYKNVRYNNLKAVFQNHPARGSDLEGFKTFIVSLLPEFSNLCLLEHCRSRAAARFKVFRKRQRTRDQIINDISVTTTAVVVTVT